MKEGDHFQRCLEFDSGSTEKTVPGDKSPSLAQTLDLPNYLSGPRSARMEYRQTGFGDHFVLLVMVRAAVGLVRDECKAMAYAGKLTVSGSLILS